MWPEVSQTLPVVLSFAASAALTPVVRGLARRWGMVARPQADRWHSRPTALLGGVAIFGAFAAVILLCLPMTPALLVVLGFSAAMFALGLVDDLVNLKPYQKLIGQILASAGVVACGLMLPWTGIGPLDMLVTVVWLVGITNAVNLLDNMDGLAAGVAAIAAAFLSAHSYSGGQPEFGLVLAVFTAALLGFLVYNSNPASIFMGDCGSLFIGFFLASAALLSPAGGRTRGFLPVLAVPVLSLFVPIFDTLLVMVLRKLAGRPVSQGGRDHTSHRLVTLGVSERRAVWMLYGFSALAGVLALLVRDLELDVSLAAILGFTTVLTLLGVHLGGVKAYADVDVAAGAAESRPVVAFLVDLSYKRRVFEVLLDVVLIGLAYYASLALVYGPIAGDGPRSEFLNVLPALVSIKVAVFLVTGVYRGLWRYISLDSLVVIAGGVTLGTAGTVAFLLLLFRGQGFPRAVFVLDWLILLMLICASRLSFRMFLQFLHAPTGSRGRGRGRPVLIYGAGDAGDLLARELINNPSYHYAPVAFLDDDPRKQGKVVHGLRVFGGRSLAAVCGEHGIHSVILSSGRFPPERIDAIVRECAASSVTLKRLKIEIEELADPRDAATLDGSDVLPSFASA